VATLGAGVAAGAAGYVLDGDPLVQVGAVLLVGGAAALAWHGLQVQRDAVTAIRVGGVGASGDGWRLTDVLGPLIAGFAIQVLIGALTNLMPAVGHDGHAQRAIARRTLGRFGTARVIGWNAGTAALTVGLLGDVPTLVTLGLGTLGIMSAAAIAALASAIVRR
jgi:nitrite reductase (NO-forming)